MKFKHVSMSACSLFRFQRRDKFEESIRPINKPFPPSSASANFPLVLDQNQFDSTSLLFTEHDEDYLRLLEAASSSSSLWEKFEPIPPDIVNRLDKSQGAAPLHYSCMSGNLPMTNFLLENGADIDIWDGRMKVTPVVAAAAHGRIHVVQLLVERGCNIDAGVFSNDSDQYSAVHWAVRGNHVEVVRYLLEQKASLNSPIPFSETPVHAAVIAGSSEVLLMLISAQNNATKADFQMDSERNTPLHLAASSSYELCKILIEKGNAYVNSVNAKKQTPLHAAVASRSEKIVRLLLFNRARVNSADEDGRTPLFYSISEEKEAFACMKTLVESRNCNVNHQDNWGNTPLHIAGKHAAMGTVEFLLRNGADFSIKAAGGVSALSILRKNIPTISSILKKTFDQAVTVSNIQIEDAKTGQEQESEIEVDFKYVLPSAPNNANYLSFQEKIRKSRSPCYARVISLLKFMPNDSQQHQFQARKETSKIKCLLKENYRNLLLHPVVHSFLELKWHKARFFFLPTLFFKIILVFLFTAFLQIPYIPMDGEKEAPLFPEEHVNSSSGVTYYYHDSNANDTSVKEEVKLMMLKTMYIPIVTMAALNAFLELSEIVRAPRQQLKTLHPWISLAVWYMMYDSRPESWEKACDPCRRSIVALGILLAWIDVWIDMARFPIVGLSIRIFLQVLKNFFFFILPHVCLLIGFIFSLSLLFNEYSIEYQSITLTLAKLIRVMAGDISITAQALNVSLTADSSGKAILHHHLVVYIYSAYVLIVAIVLMNLLIGLAVNDLQSIYADASVDKLVKQTILLNTLETSFNGRWIACCSLRRFFLKYINLFPSYSTDKTKIFRPYDPHMTELGSDQMKALLKIGNARDGKKESKKNRNLASSSTSKRVCRKNAFVNKLKSRSEDDERLMMENIDKLKLVLSYFENKLSK